MISDISVGNWYRSYSTILNTWMMENQEIFTTSTTWNQSPESSDSGQTVMKKVDMGNAWSSGWSILEDANMASNYYSQGNPLELNPGSEIRIRVPQVKTAKAPKYYRVENKVFTVSGSDATALTQFAVLSTANEAKEFVKRNNI